LTLVPCDYEALGILNDLGFGRAPRFRSLLGDGAALILHLSAVEAQKVPR
jgi:hypothetical protein